MGLSDDLASDVNDIVSQAWDIRDGRVVPESTDVAFAGGGVKLTATILYSDLADSTGLAMKYDRRVAAKVGKAFLSTCSKIIRAQDGEIRSFDGDRVMAAFIGDAKNTSAAKCALMINHCFLKILKPRLEQQYPALKEFKLAHCTGVDTSEVLIVRGGIRKNNDLIWIGQAPNAAAKLSNLRSSPHFSYITANVYKAMRDEAKLHDGKAMWERCTWNNGPVSDIYRSSWTWRP
jgi:adenylate cyclase